MLAGGNTSALNTIVLYSRIPVFSSSQTFSYSRILVFFKKENNNNNIF